MFFFMASFNLILPELNNFITLLGAPEKQGLIITFFSITALISRPFSGKLADTIGRKKVMYAGIIVATLVSLLYSLADSVVVFLALRVLHGLSAGFNPTGATALVTDLIPPQNRGRAMGIWGTFISLGIGAGQPLGSWIYGKLGFDALFMLSAVFSIISLLLIYSVEETLKNQRRFESKHLRVGLHDVVEPSVFPAAIVMLMTATCSGIIFVVTPDISEFLKIENKGFFFGIYVLSTMLVRLFTSSLSDKIGRRQTLLIGCIILFFSMLEIAFVGSKTAYTVSAIVFGFATGVTSPTLFAWTADLSHESRRGVGSGTMFIALEAGIIVGSLSTRFTYTDTFEGVKYAFLFGAGSAMLAIVFLLYHLRFKTSKY